VVHQLNRYGEKDNLVPMLHHLRGSGQIEANADVVIFLHKDKLETGGSTYYQYELIIAKNRGGQTDSIVVTFDAPYMRFA
jgi:replicative DNA helicase